MSYSHNVDDALVLTIGFGAATVRKIMQVGVTKVVSYYTHLFIHTCIIINKFHIYYHSSTSFYYE